MSHKVKATPKRLASKPSNFRYLADEHQGFYIMLPSEYMANMTWELGYKVERLNSQTGKWEEYRG